jgi:hypothetical protein
MQDKYPYREIIGAMAFLSLNIYRAGKVEPNVSNGKLKKATFYRGRLFPKGMGHTASKIMILPHPLCIRRMRVAFGRACHGASCSPSRCNDIDDLDATCTVEESLFEFLPGQSKLPTIDTHFN